MYLTKTNLGFDFICQNKAKKHSKIHPPRISRRILMSEMHKFIQNPVTLRVLLSKNLFLVRVQNAIYRDFTMPAYTNLQRFYEDEITKNNLYKYEIYKDFVDLFVSL